MGTRTPRMRSWQTAATPIFLLTTSSLLLTVQPQGPTIPGIPPPPPANTYSFSRTLGTSIPLEGAVVGAVVGGTVLAIFIWFAVRYCCCFGRSQRFLSMEMTATRRHEREQQRQRRHHPDQQQQQQGQAQQQGPRQLHAACQPGAVGVPETVFSQFPLREYVHALHVPSTKLQDPGADAPPPPPAAPPPAAPSPWWWRLPRLNPQAPPPAAAAAGDASGRTAPGAWGPPPPAGPPPGVQLQQVVQITEDNSLVAITLEPQADAPQCPICLSHFQQGIMLRRLPCSHEFHQTCIDSWMLQHRTCPLCRHTLYAQQEGS